MKKLFTLLLILYMASLAGATTISLTDENTTITATPGSTVTLTISSNADGVNNLGLLSMDVIITVNGGDIITDALHLAIAASYGWDPAFSAPPIGLGTASVEICAGSVDFVNGNLFPIIGFVDLAYTGGTQVVSIALGDSCNPSYDIMYQKPIVSTGVVTIVPEPATLVLLGLGALTILRRRK